MIDLQTLTYVVADYERWETQLKLRVGRAAQEHRRDDDDAKRLEYVRGMLRTLRVAREAAKAVPLFPAASPMTQGR